MNPSSSDTKMMNPPKNQARMVKIKALHPIRVMREERQEYLGEDGQMKSKLINAEKIFKPGEEATVTEHEAKEFCDVKFPIGIRDYFGNVDTNFIKPQTIIRAERIAEEEKTA